MNDRNSYLRQEIAKNLKKLLKEKGLTQIDVSRGTGIATSTISDYVRGASLVKIGNLEKIAEFLNVNKSDIDPTFSPFPKVNANSFESVPVVGEVSAGKPMIAEENITGYMPVLNSYIDPHKEYFFLEVQGDSMDLEFTPGSKLLVEKTNFLENGQIGVVMVNGGEATVKKVAFNENSITLIPLSSNPNHLPQTYSSRDRVTIIGKVIQAIRFIN